MAELAAAARSTYVDVREAILGLTVPLTGGGSGGAGLGAVLEGYANRFADAAKLVVSVDVDSDLGDTDVTPEVLANLLRIVQEALTNVRKHANAQRVAIRVQRDHRSLVLVIEDDGRGFDPSAPDLTSGWPHFGRETIRQRAAAIGGHATWDSAPNRGTRLWVEVPA
jgi:signal transduction histidine kinase